MRDIAGSATAPRIETKGDATTYDVTCRLSTQVDAIRLLVYYLEMSKKTAPKKRTWVSLTLPPEMIEKIERQAEVEVRPRAQMIRALLLRALAQNEKTA